MEEANATVAVGFHDRNGHVVFEKTGAGEGEDADADSDFTVEVENEEKDGTVVVDDDDEEDCCMENLDNCCGENVRGVRDCACCLKQCTCEIFHGCRHLNYKRFAKSTFNKESVMNKFPVLKWLPKYR